MMNDDEYEDDSVLVGRENCPTCGSEDNLARYSDGHAYCFGATCNHFEPPTDDAGQSSAPRNDRQSRPADLIEGSYSALRARHLTEETCKLFKYKIGTFKGQPVHAAGYHLKDGTLVAQKLRFANKKEGMPWLGDKAQRKQVALFGSHRFGKGKKIVITEGEIDAMTVSQVQGNKWPAVSLINGADGAAKDIANNLEYLANFDEIILMFDQDDAGRAAVESAAAVLTGQTVLVATLPLKDASECHVAGKSEDIIKAIWNAKPYAPESVLFGEEIWTRLQNRPEVTSIPFPEWMPIMNSKVLGIRLGELDTYTSGSGMGKTTLIKQLQAHLLRTTDLNQAIIHLEEPLEDTAESFLGVMMEKRLTLPEVREQVTQEDLRRTFEKVFMSKDREGNHRVYLHDAFGSMGSDEDLMNRIRYYAHAHNCKAIWIDHLSILVSGMGEDGDERRRIDQLMHNLKELTVELGIYIGLISHLKKAQSSGPSFEEGAVPSLDDLRGSGGIKQLSNSVYAMSRNQQAETEFERNMVQVHVLKSRYTGDTGPADFIAFNKLTGTFEIGSDPNESHGFEDMTQGAGGEASDPFRYSSDVGLIGF
jgi:twinkle protein